MDSSADAVELRVGTKILTSSNNPVQHHLTYFFTFSGYVAPEIFTAGLHGGYGNKVDIFSCGVTLYVMLCGYEPFYGTSDEELIEANRNAELEFPKEEWSTVSPQAINLVKSMMSVDPEKRPSASSVLSDPWILKHVQRVSSPPERGNMNDSCLIL